MKAFRVSSLVLGAAFAAALVPGSASASTTGSAWPEMLGDKGHSSYSTDSKISNASKFGIKWMANLFNSDMGSPVVAYNTTLKQTVVYAGNERADVFALSAATGKILWSTNLGVNDKIEDTPAVGPDGSVWVGTSSNPTLYKLNGATGALECSTKANLRIDASPLVVTPPGGVPTVVWAWVDSSTIKGVTLASRTADCSQIWSFDQWVNPSSAGEWASPAYGLSANGEPLVFVGTADGDSTEYAMDAVTGKLLWKYSTQNPEPYTYDIGDASTVSAPGKNGLSDGALYFDSKYGIMYALDLTTGAPLWQFIIAPGTKAQSSRSSAALDGNQLVFGYGDATGFGGGGGVYNLNSLNGNVNWQYQSPNGAEVLSSVAVVGSPGSEIVTFGDIGGVFRVLDLANGNQLYNYQTGGYITSSPAEADGTIYIAGSDGFLYAFAPNEPNGTPPSSGVTYPQNDTVIANPNGTLTVTGTASDTTGVRNVEVAVQMNGTSGPWLNGANGQYNVAPIRNSATLSSPGGTTTNWSYTIPAPASGGTFTVFASAVNKTNLVNKSAISAFTISPSKGEPNITTSATYIPPGATFTARATGFKPSEKVDFSLFGSIVATATATKTGYVPNTNIAVSQNASFGPTSLTLTGETSHKAAATTIQITNNWTQGGHDAMRSGEEPHDPVIEKSTSVGNGSVLSQSWYYDASAPVNSSPTVVDGVAYFGNDAGALSAVVVNTGAPAWTYTLPDSAPIRTAPGVDLKGNVIVAAADGNLYFVNKTGQQTGSIAIGGNLTSPAVDASNVFVASDSGKIFDVSETSGSIAWSASLSGAGHSAPAYDAANNVVVAGDDGGAVTAFNATTGAQLWQVKTGGAVKANPMIWKGVVYVGSADKYLYAINESTGATNWKFQASGAIVAGAAMLGSNIQVGDMNGMEYSVNLHGAQVAKTNSNDSRGIVGISTVEGNTFVTLADGEIGMIRPDGPVPFGWSFQSNSTLSTTPAIVDGTVYLGAAGGGVYAFTPQGANPLSKTHKPVISITDSNAWSCSTP